MAKKYQPSGYQIINLDYPDIESGTTLIKTPETEDEKILEEILSSEKIKKPVLITINCSGTLFSEFAPRMNNAFNLGGFRGDNSYVSIGTNEDHQLEIDYVEI